MSLFTCDELTPSLCDLRVTNGSLAVRGLEVQYTHYHAVNPDRSKLPIVMVHGGPGWSHHYMLPLKQQACRGRDVYFYDQAGAGTSERPTPSSRIAAPWLFNLSYYPEEMMAVVAHLGLARHHVLGSSWGTIVAQLYALRHPPGLASLTLSGPLSDSQLYKDSQWDALEGTSARSPHLCSGGCARSTTPASTSRSSTRRSPTPSPLSSPCARRRRPTASRRRARS